MKDVPKELNTKAYAMTIKKDKILNQCLGKQIKTGLIVELSSRYVALCFLHPKERWITMIGTRL